MQQSNYTIKLKDEDIYLIPKADHTQTLIWLHGLGDQASSFLPIFNQKNSPVSKTTKVVMLTAGKIPVTFNGGMVMTAWYDFKSLDCSSVDGFKYVNQETVKSSAERIQQIMKEEIALLKEDSTKLFIGGFSQGAILSLYCGLQYNQKIAGILAFSGILFPIISTSPENQTTPIFITHGEKDPVIPYTYSMLSYEKILEGKNKVTKIVEKVGHTIVDSMWEGMESFMKERSEVVKSKL